MAKVIITSDLEKQINRAFKAESVEIFSLMSALKDNPKKGKEVCAVGNVIVKEIRYKKYGFYFIADRYKIKFLLSSELKDLLIKFVRMSGKKNQQKVIDEIKDVLRMVGEEGF
ncbi:hypothetical protein GF345_05315 [Candidatus Woesearchaeota archaeon]|nr:hypothetical protein [Candidatus Woesearchaeota archaeon]